MFYLLELCWSFIGILYRFPANNQAKSFRLEKFIREGDTPSSSLPQWLRPCCYRLLNSKSLIHLIPFKNLSLESEPDLIRDRQTKLCAENSQQKKNLVSGNASDVKYLHPGSRNFLIDFPEIFFFLLEFHLLFFDSCFFFCLFVVF